MHMSNEQTCQEEVYIYIMEKQKKIKFEKKKIHTKIYYMKHFL